MTLSRPTPPKLEFGFKVLDDAADGGLRLGGVFVLAAPPKHHKTALLISFHDSLGPSGAEDGLHYRGEHGKGDL